MKKHYENALHQKKKTYYSCSCSLCSVVHSDVEPSNVMFTTKRAWWVKLVDFGRARFVGSKNGLAGDGQLIAEWTAPEILATKMPRNGGGGGPTNNGRNVVGAAANGIGANNGTNGQQQQQQQRVEQLANPQTDMWGFGLITFCLCVSIFTKLFCQIFHIMPLGVND